MVQVAVGIGWAKCPLVVHVVEGLITVYLSITNQLLLAEEGIDVGNRTGVGPSAASAHEQPIELDLVVDDVCGLGCARFGQKADRQFSDAVG